LRTYSSFLKHGTYSILLVLQK